MPTEAVAHDMAPAATTDGAVTVTVAATGRPHRVGRVRRRHVSCDRLPRVGLAYASSSGASVTSAIYLMARERTARARACCRSSQIKQPALRPDADVAAVRQLRRRARGVRRRSRERAASSSGRAGARRAAAGTSSSGTRAAVRTICRASSTRSRCGCRSQAGMWDQLDRKVRNQVRKAEKSDLTVDARRRRAASASSTPSSRATCATSARRSTRGACSRKCCAAFPDRARIIVVRLKDAADRRRASRSAPAQLVEMPWASSIRDFNSLCPNHLLYWHAIETAVAEGCDDVRLRPVDARTKAPTSSRNSGAPSRCRCTGSTGCSATAARPGSEPEESEVPADDRDVEAAAAVAGERRRSAHRAVDSLMSDR